ncbi:MAG: hypothetical protein K9J42_12540 [Sulfuritalea sp.]|nr:hypothetical protein [Sulfuritalea sp.]
MSKSIFSFAANDKASDFESTEMARHAELSRAWNVGLQKTEACPCLAHLPRSDASNVTILCRAIIAGHLGQGEQKIVIAPSGKLFGA